MTMCGVCTMRSWESGLVSLACCVRVCLLSCCVGVASELFRELLVVCVCVCASGSSSLGV